MKSNVSHWLRAIFKVHLFATTSYKRAMRRALNRKPFLHTDGRYPSREELYDLARLR